MAKKAFFSAGELKRMAQLANAENVTVELERDGTIARVMPYRPAKMSPREEDGPSALEQWKAERDRRRKIVDKSS